ncbi:MAG: dihydroorotate dehydrogenase [Desulfobacterales bacterium]|nr:dihydroorotate dehydrogenase [Desulfobacterales bacterium]
MTASGTFGYGIEFADFLDLSKLGGVIVKGLSLLPSAGNPPPRIVETASGMLNAIGLENIGIEAFITEKLPYLKSYHVPVFVNIYGKTIEEYARITERINREDDIAGIEVNISCPNVKAGGAAFGANPDTAAIVVETVKKITQKPVMVKLSPNVTDIVAIALRVEAAGADSISLINTLIGMAIDIETRKPKLANITGGLSGPAIKPIALRMVFEVARRVHIPVIGIGGIMTPQDAIEFLIAGASAIQIGTANFINPQATLQILNGIVDYMQQKQIGHISELIGCLT